MQVLPDYLAYNLKIIFIGYNPGEKSSLLGHHYAGPGNLFWKLLYESGLTNRLFDASEDKLLMDEGYGLTNLVSRPSKSSSDLATNEMEAGSVELREKLYIYKPSIACFLGKDIYRKYAKLKPAFPVHYGLVQKNYGVSDMREFVAPNPSARSTVPYQKRLDIFTGLKKLLI